MEGEAVVATLRCKVAVCGASGVGKTALINCLVNGGKAALRTKKLTSGVEVTVFPVRLPHAPVVVELFLFDTSGDPLYWDLIPQYWNGVNNAVLVYDASDLNTVQDCTKWYELLLKLRQDKSERVHCVLVGNKSDCVQTLDTSVAERVARSWTEDEDVPIYQVASVSAGTNCEEPFMHIATEFHRMYEEKLLQFEHQNR
ncbi:hypothetical protein BSKO_01758 [Bryopsis sp. KO-2023]|nr:hypothetical protein BSKO_01758 [Bryopsis sp. KO-2023]